MRYTLLQRSTVAAIVLAMSTGVIAQGRLSVPADPNLAKQISAAVRTAEDDGNHAAALREERRLLEVYPNEPVLQASIYQMMSATAEKSGDAKAGVEFAAIATALDPTLAGRLQAEQSKTVTRADKADKAMAAMSVVMATMAAVQQARQSKAQPQAPPSAPQPPAPDPQQQMQPQPQPQMQPMQQPQQPPQYYAYPPAPIGQPGYQPQPAPQPMPGYQPVSYAPPGYAPQPAGYAPPQGYQPQGPPPAGYPSAGAPPQGPPPPGYVLVSYYAPANPNAAPVNYAPPGTVVRGNAFKPIRVVHDHSMATEKAYFANACGALLSVDGTVLTFTPGGGEAPRVINAADIREMRMNTTVGKDIGAFHIATKQGLYLHLAPASGKAEDARAMIDALTKALGL